MFVNEWPNKMENILLSEESLSFRCPLGCLVLLCHKQQGIIFNNLNFKLVNIV